MAHDENVLKCYGDIKVLYNNFKVLIAFMPKDDILNLLEFCFKNNILSPIGDKIFKMFEYEYKYEYK